MSRCFHGFAPRPIAIIRRLKSYSCFTITQQKLINLATIVLEVGVLEKIDYEHIIECFILMFHSQKYYICIF